MQRAHEQGRSASSVAREIETDLCIIGAGSGGLSVAAAAAAFGRKVVLIEKHKMGGDCLNYGCVPSKALLAAAKHAHAFRTGSPFGVSAREPEVDWAAVSAHVKNVIASIAPNDSVERFTGLGVQVIQAPGHFLDRATVAAGDWRIKARRFVVATGSAPAIPPIPGLDKVPFFTNETLFDNQKPIAHLVVIGGGPIGMEMAQAHRRLGARVTVIEGFTALGKDDPEVTAVALAALRREGIDIRERTKVEAVAAIGEGIEVSVAGPDGPNKISGSHLLVAAGRRANITGLGLDVAGITTDKGRIVVDDTLVTTNPKVFAIGDCTGGLQFTHVANDHAGIVIRRALFRLPAKANPRRVPWVTYTTPEVAHVGLTEAQATATGHKINVLRWPYHENDRAQAERATEGLVKVVTDTRGRILGASIVGLQAGELIQIWSLAVAQGLKIKAMTDWISPYPTLGEVNKRAAVRYYATAASKPLVRKIVDLLARLG